MEAGKRTIREIFNRGRNLEIPFFQRAYVWDIDQWQRFLDDMRIVSENRRPYFLGSVILKQQETTSSSDARLTVIDGQQRLTTLNIFLKVLCLKNGTDGDFTETFKKQRDKSIILLHNHNDVASFNRIVNLDKLDEVVSHDSDKIVSAYNFFKENISTSDVEGGLNFFNILDNIMFVGIDLNYEEDEQQIFDTINSLGVRLTTAELLKNYFFSRDQIGLYEDYWREVFEKNDETRSYWDQEILTGRLRRTFIDLFFYAYLQIKIQDPQLKVKDKVEFSRVEVLFDSYKKLINLHGLDKNDLLIEIRQYAILFRENFDPLILQDELTSESGMDRINAIIFGLDNSTLIPYVLYILKKISNYDERNLLFATIESYTMRRIITHASAKNYNQLFTDRLIGNQVLSKQDFIDFMSKRDDKINAIPSDEEMEYAFLNNILINKQTAGILYFIESKIRNRQRQSTQLLGMEKYSLEHLMPKKWINHWSPTETEEQARNRDKKLATIGNLAIITQTLNTSIRDADWNTKKYGSGEREGLIHYSSGIETLAPYLQLHTWDESEIEKRAMALYNHAKNIWIF